jgi:Asp-tRNA(Asn)/Glu-tRNA(Gln) amidotransferase A subunit family amidase
MGMNTSMPGQEAIPSVFSPMARTLNDLTYFTRSLIQMKPWRYDYTVHPLEWREHIERDYKDKKKLRVGVMRTDGVVDPSPACVRALEKVAVALAAEGHEVYDVNPPSPYEALYLASQLLLSDGGKTFMSFFRTGEWNDLGAKQMVYYMNLPRPVKYVYYLWVKYIKRDDILAGLLRDWHAKTAYEYWQLAGRREAYKNKFFNWWNEEAKMDFMITPPNATPAVPHGGMHDVVSSCGYTFLFNLVSVTFHLHLVWVKANDLVARLHGGHHPRHACRSSSRPTPGHIRHEKTERCGTRSIQTLRRYQDGWTTRWRASRGSSAGRRKGACAHGADRRCSR